MTYMLIYGLFAAPLFYLPLAYLLRNRDKALQVQLAKFSVGYVILMALAISLVVYGSNRYEDWMMLTAIPQFIALSALLIGSFLSFPESK